MLEYLEKLTSFHPVSSDQKSVLKLLEYVGDHLRRRGFKIQTLTYNGYVNLYASPEGKKHSKVLLQSHVDVVPGGPAFKIEGDKCFGRGTYDMLFAVAAYMRLVDELHKEGKQCDIALMLSGDEEINSKNGVEAILKEGYTADVCILPDAGDDWGSLSVAAKGIYQPTISIHGQAHHGSRPWEGDGAAIKLAHFLVEAEALFDTSDEHNSTLTVSKLTAGEVHNQGPSDAEAALDIRYKDQADLSRIIRGMEPLLKKYNGEVITQMDGFDYQLNPDVPLIKEFIALYEKHVGRPIRMTKAHGSSDARFFSKHNISVIMLRPDGGGAHNDIEWISIPHLEQFYELLKEYVVTTSAKVY